jgi:hypothetical protein
MSVYRQANAEGNYGEALSLSPSATVELGSTDKKRPTQARKSTFLTREGVLFDAANPCVPHGDISRTWNAVLPKLLAHLTAQNDQDKKPKIFSQSQHSA